MGNWASTDGSMGVGGKTPLPVSRRAIENMDKKIRLQLLQSITPKYSCTCTAHSILKLLFPR